MKRFNFIPYWYKEYERKKAIKSISMIVILFVTADFLLVSAFIYLYGRCDKAISHSVPVFSYDPSQSEKKLFQIKKEKIMKNMNSFMSFVNKNIVINEAVIEPRNIRMNASVKSMDEYYDFIGYVEGVKSVHIKSLSAHSFENEEATFDILLEAEN